MKKTWLTILGFTVLGIGAAGVFVPVLPTTPFVLLAAACFSASSPKFYAKLKHSPFFGDYIRGIKEKKPIPTKARVQGIAALWILITISALIVREQRVTIILLIVGICVTIHLLTICRGGGAKS